MKRGDKNETTWIAVLGTLAEFHKDPLPYDLAALIDLVAEIHPDLLCLDISPEQWQLRQFDELPLEYSRALLPLAAQTDIVVVPIGSEPMMPRASAPGWRGWVINRLRSLLNIIQAGANGPDGINEGWRHDLANFLYGLVRQLAGSDSQQAYMAHIDTLTEATLAVAAENSGSRILVVTNIQYCHHVRPHLQGQSDLQVVPYTEI